MIATVSYAQYKYRNIGLAGGSLWMVAIGTVYAVWALLVARSTSAIELLAAVSVAAIALAIFGITVIRRAIQLPAATAALTPEGRKVTRRMGIKFGIIVAVEGIACAAVSVGCMHLHHWRYIVPLCLIVVGLHFLPLAKLFAVPRYYITGIFFCAIPIATMLLVSQSARIGNGWSWIILPSVGCALVALITAWAGLNEASRSLNNLTTP